MSVATATTDTQPRPYRFPPSVPARIRTLADLPADLLREYPRPDLLQQCSADGLKPLATADLVERVRAMGLALADMGIAPGGFALRATVRTTGPTGVEMEALTAVSVAALTVYDMLKAVDRAMVIEHVTLVEKRGGRSGTYVRATRDGRRRPRPGTPQ